MKKNMLLCALCLVVCRLSADSLLSKSTRNFIAGLHPEIRTKTERVLEGLHRDGVDVHIVQGFRSYEEQDRLYRIGRDAAGKVIGRVVTNARGGQSYHNFGLAFDVEIYYQDPATGKIRKDWNVDGSSWKKYVAAGEREGFVSGSTFVGLLDYPHMQMSFGFPAAELDRRLKNGEVTGGFVNVK